MSETGKDAASVNDVPFDGTITESAGQYGQTLDLGYAHKKPTWHDLFRMIELLRSTADSIEKEMRR